VPFETATLEAALAVPFNKDVKLPWPLARL
jgi:hypothetical protein